MKLETLGILLIATLISAGCNPKKRVQEDQSDDFADTSATDGSINIQGDNYGNDDQSSDTSTNNLDDLFGDNSTDSSTDSSTNSNNNNNGSNTDPSADTSQQNGSNNSGNSGISNNGTADASNGEMNGTQQQGTTDTSNDQSSGTRNGPDYSDAQKLVNQGYVKPYQVDQCCGYDYETHTSTCSKRLCLKNETDKTIVGNGEDFVQTITMDNKSDFKFRNVVIRDHLPTVDIDGHIYPAVHEVRSFKQDEMDTQIYWVRPVADCDAHYASSVNLRVNPLICAGESINLTASIEGDHIAFRNFPLSIDVTEAVHDVSGEAPGINSPEYWYDQVRGGRSFAEIRSTITFFSKVFSEKQGLNGDDELRCLLSTNPCANGRTQLLQALIVLWLDVTTHHLSPCTTLRQLGATDLGISLDMTIAELIANLERVIYCDVPEEIDRYTRAMQRLIPRG